MTDAERAYHRERYARRKRDPKYIAYMKAYRSGAAYKEQRKKYDAKRKEAACDQD